MNFDVGTVFAEVARKAKKAFRSFLVNKNEFSVSFERATLVNGWRSFSIEFSMEICVYWPPSTTLHCPAVVECNS